MQMIPRGKNFTLIFESQDLSRGIRPSKRAPRNSGYLVESAGTVGKDGVLQTLDPMDSMDLSAISDGFPYPQLFVFPQVIIVCSKNTIYEWVSGTLIEQITVPSGVPWKAVSIARYVYFSNRVVSVVRDPLDNSYAISDLPVASCICNYNGQIFIGAPEVVI